MDKQDLNEDKKKAIQHLTEALGEEARTKPDTSEEAEARDHRAEAEEEIARSRKEE